MKAEYMDGDQPGEGYIILSGALLPAEPWSISLQRAVDQLFLTGKKNNPWVGDRVFIPITGSADADGSLRLGVGPEVVDQLDQRDQYRLTLKGSGEECAGRLRIGQITHSRGDVRHNTGQMPGEKPQAAPAAPAAPVPPPLSSPPRPEQPPLGTEEPLRMAEKPASKTKLWRWLILAALVLGCLAWFFLDQRKKEGDASPPAASQQATPAPKTPGTAEQVRQFFKDGKHSPAEALALAEKLQAKNREEQDAVYRLWYFAAENGEPKAYIKYGNILDPAEPAFGSIEKNAPAAWAIYEKAQNEAAKAKLRQYLQDQIAKGDEQAKTWLLEIDRPR